MRVKDAMSPISAIVGPEHTLQQAATRMVQHRTGALTVGDTAVAVVAASAHRAEAFEACRYVIEELKKRVPVWKKEMFVDGTVEWVDPTASRVTGLESRGRNDV